MLVFTNKSQVYKCKVAAFEDTKSAQLGSYLPTDLEMEPDESVIWVIDPEDYKADVLLGLENAAWCASRFRYVTKTNRKRLQERHLRWQQATVCPGAQGRSRHRAGLERLSFDELQHVATQDQDDHQHAGRNQAFTAKKGRSVTVGTTEEILGAGVSAEKFTAQSLPSAGALMKENDMPSLFD